jgi:heterodisulfide reductase subunit B2
MAENKQASGGNMAVNYGLAKRIMEELGENVHLCYQCVKCTSGCPVGQYFDWQPNQIMRSVQLGQEDVALESETPWLCASCHTCATRCPQGLDITAIMEFLTREAKERGIKPKIPEVDVFNKAFMREVKLWGRAYEPGLMAEYKLRTIGNGKLLDDAGMYINMLKKRKVGFLPKKVSPSKNVKPIPGAENSIAYYPGCSLHSSATEYDVSTKAVCEAVGLNLIEPEDWLCCGASAAHRSDPEEGLRLPLENLALIEKSGFKEVTMPCASCFNRHKTAQHEFRHDEEKRTAMSEIGYQDNLQVSTLSETLLRHVGTTGISDKVKRPLEGLRVVSYYGCLLTRPAEVTEVEDPENPIDLDELMTALGAEVIDWSYKTSCCGASHSLSRPDIVRNLSGSIVSHAQEAGADVIAVACPLCHMNLDARQGQMTLEDTTPVMFFTQLMALALGLPEKAAALNKNMVDPRELLRSKNLID